MKFNFGEKLTEIQIKYGIADRQLSKMIRISPKKLEELKQGSSITFENVIYYTKRMKIPPEEWGFGKIESAMINKGINWNMLSIEADISAPVLKKIAQMVDNSDFRVKRAYLNRVCAVLGLAKGQDFRDLYPEGSYNERFKEETPKERKRRLKGSFITGKIGSLPSLRGNKKELLMKRAEDECSPAAKEPGFDIQDFINRQADRMRTGK